MKLIQILICVIGLATISFGSYLLFTASGPSPVRTMSSSDYEGVIKADGIAYKVAIREDLCCRDFQRSITRFVRLNLVNLSDGNVLFTISGRQHCLNMWDEVGFCGEKNADGQTTGYNSVVDDGNGWCFKPYPSDKMRVEPLSEKKVFEAMSLLDRAMAECHNPDHMILSYIWNEGKQRYDTVSYKK